jgi:hypothetical protein
MRPRRVIQWLGVGSVHEPRRWGGWLLILQGVIKVDGAHVAPGKQSLPPKRHAGREEAADHLEEIGQGVLRSLPV